MKLHARHIEREFQRNFHRHVLANELRLNIQRMKECLTGDSLPLPTAEVIAAWNALPNATVDTLPMSMKAGWVFLPAPPPTPAEPAFDAYDLASDGSSANGSTEGSWLLVNDKKSRTLDLVAFRSPGRSTMSDGDTRSRCGNSERSTNQQSASSPSPSTDHESLLSSGGSSPTPMEFNDIADRWFVDYHVRGIEAFIEALMAFAVGSPGNAALASRIARAVIRRVAKMSYTEGKGLERTIRCTALETFKRHWKSNDTWMEASSARATTVPPSPYGINISSFVGSLFDTGICNARDVFLCLSLLTEGEKGFDRLCGMHALLVLANDKLCKNRNLSGLLRFQQEITTRNGETGEYLWITAPRSSTIITDILSTIERWIVSQALRRDRSRISPSHRAIRQRAVGPRLRSGVELLVARV